MSENAYVNATVTALFSKDTSEEDKKAVTKFIAEFRPEAIQRWNETEEGGVMIKMVDTTQYEMRRFGNTIRNISKAKRMTYQVFPTEGDLKDDNSYEIYEKDKVVGVGDTK